MSTQVPPSRLDSTKDFSSLVPSAFARANAAFLQANNSTDTWVRTQANNAYDAASSSGSFANGAFVRANSSYVAQNTTASFANGAFDRANSVSSFANGAFITANASASFANGAFDRANSSYLAQNTTSEIVTIAFVVANSGSTFANAAFARANAAYEQANTASGAAVSSTPKISSIVYPGNDTAANTGGGQTVTLTGSGFNAGATVLINGTYASVVSVANSTSLSFTTPANSSGTYPLYVVNTDGGTGISVPGISYSGTPNWSTASGSIATLYETAALSNTVTATGGVGDGTITYSLQAGTLPAGSSLNTSTGLISGTANGVVSSTTYTFTILASDAQNQDTERTFTITINPDIITWSSPADGTSTDLFQNIAMSNVALSATSAAGKSITYTANALPTGVTISGSNVTGTPTDVGNTTSVITATSATTNKTATRTFTWVVSIANDTYFKNTTLLLNGETTVTPFISDASTNSLGLTINGDTKPTPFNPYTPGYYSNFFDGTGDYLTLPNSESFAFGTGDFTIEFWLNTTDTGAGLIGQATSGGWAFNIYSNTIYWASAWNSVNLWNYSAATITNGAWHHLAFSRVSGSTKFFIDGELAATNADSTNYTATAGNIQIGRDANPADLAGYISNLRIIKGTGLYTSAFTPSTTPLTAIANTSLLTCQSNRLIDNSTNNFAITKVGDTTISPNIPFTANASYSTYGSTYFDGTGDYLTNTTNNTALAMGSGDFTIEFWMNATNGTIAIIFDTRISTAQGNNQGGMQVYHENGTIYFYGGANNAVSLCSSSVTYNTWNHVAIVRSGSGSGNVKMYINGALSSTYGSADTTNYSLGYLNIGTFRFGGTPSTFYNGYISNFRLIKGTAVYTSAFTPPTAPLTAITNTSLLTLQYNQPINNNVFLDQSNFNNIITRFGNTSQGSFSPYSVTGWSNYFGSTSDYLQIPSTSLFLFGTGDFTIEAWVYHVGAAPGGGVTNDRFIFGRLGTVPNCALFLTNDLLRPAFWDGTNQRTSSSGVTPNTWTHISVSRISNNIYFSVNGVVDQQSTSGVNFVTASVYNIGRNDAATDRAFPGYISNLRVVKGTGLYSSNFTPSTTPLTPITNTALLTCQSNGFIDNSPSNFTLTRAGNVSVQALDPFGSVPEATPLSYSNYFDGTGDYLDSATSSAFTYGTGDFTIEFWAYLTAIGGTPNLIDQRGGTHPSVRPTLYINSDVLTYYTSGAARIVGSTLSTNVWYHIALSRNSGTTRLFVNGSQVGSSYTDGNNYNSTKVRVFTDDTGGSTSQAGYCSNLRILKGTGLYTTTFTPSTTPLTAIANTSLLTCQSTRMIDNSTNSFTITAAGNVKPKLFNPFGYTSQTYTSYTPSLHGGSAYFDGTGDNLSIPANAVFQLTGDFTVEAWVYLNTINSYNMVFGSDNGASSDYLGIRASTVELAISNAAYPAWSYTFATGTWYHIAVTRSSNSLKAFVNGVELTLSSGSATNSSQYFQSSVPMMIGRYGNTSTPYYFTGYISNARIVKGTAVYTSAFTPPTSPLTAISGTSLLLNFNNGGIIDQHSSNVIETVGNAQLSTSVKKYNNASIYFDGSGDYLYAAPNLNYAMGSNNFTIEFWYYPVTHTNTDPALIGNYNATWTSNKWTLHAPHASYTNKYSLWVNNYSTNSAILVSTSTIADGAWVHIAISRSGSTWKMFINGTVEATTTSAAALDGGTAASMDGLYVGANFYSGGGGRHINAYIDDLRITKGYARYTANFTAPTNALATK